MRIIVVDHLPCLNNELGLCTGISQQGITEFGRSLAKYVRLPMSEYGGISAVFCSTLPRALESANLCFGERNVPIICDDRLRAVNYGEFQQARMADIVRTQASYLNAPFPGGESYSDMAERYKHFFDEVKVRFMDQSVVLIGHYGTRELMRYLCLSVPLDRVFAAEPPITSMSRREAIEARFSKSEYLSFEWPK